MLETKSKINFNSYDATNCHELNSSFRFRLFGSFRGLDIKLQNQNVTLLGFAESLICLQFCCTEYGIPFAHCMDRVAKRLSIVGFVRPFSRGAVGEVTASVIILVRNSLDQGVFQVQGDTFAVSDV